MSFIIVLSGIVLLVLLITLLRLNAFLAFLIVSILMGLVKHMTVTAVVGSIQKGIGDILGSLVILIGLGAMLGKLIADSGAAVRISTALTNLFGKKYLQWAMVLTAFIVGIPLFYGVGFVLLVPLVITVTSRYNIPAVYIGLPTLAALSVTHGYLPPHPSPVALIQQFHAQIGMTLLYGLCIAIPAIILAGPVFSITLKKYTAKPLATFAAKEIPESELPGTFTSFMAAFLPVVLIALHAVLQITTPATSKFYPILHSIDDGAMAVIAMLISVLTAAYTLGVKRGKKMEAVMGTLSESVKDVVLILLIIGGAGALKQVLTDSGLNNAIVDQLQNMHVHPLLLAWSISAIIRVCIGSATIAGVTTAGIVAPLIATTGVNPNLMVLATGAGSLMFSHVNDPGFWMFKEYFNLTFKDTLKTWSIMETIVSVVGLVGVFVINSFL
ncbi:gluconate:H+ symporter [Deminuibacter soli]|uniref:Gluconate transporter n=1 Tax=Deminuibacter soli TaxID=2291815 RepID=A0A3E1NNE7_9BACT|nr:gluconate:H+ symporter [Deminuibacter soli]RFM29451.1 gluconate transporter [Deminuibacter soli]